VEDGRLGKGQAYELDGQRKAGRTFRGLQKVGTTGSRHFGFSLIVKP
jgi:hypothetical protein